MDRVVNERPGAEARTDRLLSRRCGRATRRRRGARTHGRDACVASTRLQIEYRVVRLVAYKGVTVTQIVGGSAAVLWDIKYKKSLYYFGHPLRFAC